MKKVLKMVLVLMIIFLPSCDMGGGDVDKAVQDYSNSTIANPDKVDKDMTALQELLGEVKKDENELVEIQ